jgi:DNA-binding transcriptional MerR regulator
MRVDDLNTLDLSHTPPLGDPRDAVQLAAQNWVANVSSTSLPTNESSFARIRFLTLDSAPGLILGEMQADKIGVLRIGVIAEKSGLSRDALRFYERRGLLPAARRTAGGFRVYPAETLARLRFIKQAQMVGLTLHEIAALVSHRNDSGLRRCRHVRDLLRAKVADVQTKLSELEAFRTTLARYLEQCERTLSNGGEAKDGEAQCPVIDTLTREP